MTASELARVYGGAWRNVGALVGEPSGWLEDVDLDAHEAIALADAILPPTASIFGRASKPRSHRLYVAADTTTVKYEDPGPPKEGTGRTLLELRSTGAQTVLPGSLHASGEPVDWVEDGDPAEIDAGELRRACDLLAAASLLRRCYPGQGGRHDYCLDIAGVLARAVPPEEAERILLAIARAAGDKEARSRLGDLRTTLRRLAAGHPATGWPRLAQRIGQPRTAAIKQWLEGGASGSATASASGSRKRSQASDLVALGDGWELWHTPDGTACATIAVGDHREHHLLRSRAIRVALSRAAYMRTGRPARGEALREALDVLEGRALYDGDEHAAELRVGEHGGAIYLDLGDPAWRAVEIDAGGWRVVSDSPVRFRRARALAPLPEPVRGGRIEELRAVLPVTGDDWLLVVAWLVSALRPRGPYPLLELHGEAGTGKSTAARIVRSLVDPSTVPLRAEPRNTADLVIAASHAWVLAVDNVSGLSGWLSDALCRVATGGGYGARQLYTDSDEWIIDAQRPVILTGIEDVATRGDLADRTIAVTLSPIADEDRRTEAEIWAAADALRPRVLGVLCDAVSQGLRDEPSVRLDRLPRMADAARWVYAAAPGAGLDRADVLEAWNRRRRDAATTTIEASEIGPALLALLDGTGEWIGTATELLAALGQRAGEDLRRDRHRWPQTVQALTGALTRLAPALRSVGVVLERSRGSTRRLLTLRRAAGTPATSSPSSSGVAGAEHGDDEVPDEVRGHADEHVIDETSVHVEHDEDDVHDELAGDADEVLL